jgi:zinc ribbon protein
LLSAAFTEESERTMASFCTKCGTANTGDNAFCTKCGAPVGAAVGSVSGAPMSSVPVASAYAQPVAVPAKGGGNSALKVVLIIVAVFVGLGILSVCAVMFGIWRVSKAVHVSSNGGVTVSTPTGTMTAGNAGSVSASDLGVDIYPGATQQQGAVKVSTPNGTAITAAYTTNDSLDKVVDFYKGKLGSSASVFQSDKSAVLSETSDDKKSSVMVTIATEASNGQTKIAILHSTGNGS